MREKTFGSSFGRAEGEITSMLSAGHFKTGLEIFPLDWGERISEAQRFFPIRIEFFQIFTG